VWFEKTIFWNEIGFVIVVCRFGNTSSSSLWYELAYAEAKGKVKRGDRVWQIAFGSGFKCNSAVWRAMRTIKPPALNPWNDVIDKYPVKLIEDSKLEVPARELLPKIPMGKNRAH